LLPFLGTPVFFLQIEPKSADFLYSGVFGHGELESSRIFLFWTMYVPLLEVIYIRLILNRFEPIFIKLQSPFFIKLSKNNLFCLDFVCISHKNRKKINLSLIWIIFKEFFEKNPFLALDSKSCELLLTPFRAFSTMNTEYKSIKMTSIMYKKWPA
jgi:hypothetical protein